MTRVTFASPHPIPEDLVGRCASDDVRPLDAPFGHAVHVFADVPDPEALRLELRDSAGEDVAVAVVDGPLERDDAGLVLCDVDSTFTTTEAIDLLAEHAGTGAEVAAITEAAMRGELDFEASLRRRVATLAGLPVRICDEVYPRMALTSGARELVAATHARGAAIGVTSGGFTHLVGPLAEELGLDHWNANQLETHVVDGVECFTGAVVGQVVDRAQKARDLRRFSAARGLELAWTVAVGDGANDLAMLATAGLGVAFRAKPVTAAQADVHIAFPHLDAVAALAFPRG